MLIATGKHTRRLILPSDEEQVHSGRTGKMFPDPGELPEQYLSLLEWAKKRYNDAAKARTNRDPHMGELSHVKSEESPNAGQWLESLFELEGLGKEYWKDIDPDEFVRKLREGWE